MTDVLVTDVVVVGAGPAGTMAALRAAQLGARTALVTEGAFGGMAANDGPVPVRTLAHAARLMREARQLPAYGIGGAPPELDYGRLLVRVSDVVAEVAARSSLRAQVEAAGATIREHEGRARFVGPNTLETATGRRFHADRVILCTGGVSRRLDVPGFELTATHSDAWSLTAVPPSMLVIGSGATGAQVASVFSAFGTQVQLFEAGERILRTEEPEVSACVAAAYRAAGVVIHERFGAIHGFEATPDGIRMTYGPPGEARTAEAALCVVAVGWTADTQGLNLPAAGVETDARGFVRVDAAQQTTAPHVYVAGDVAGVRMLVPQALQAGFTAATNAVTGSRETAAHAVNPVGSFTDPEYAQVGLGEAAARAEGHDIEVVAVPFAETTRAIIDGRTTGLCKLIVARDSHALLGCHLVGERAVDVAQVAAVAMAGGLTVDALARLPLSFPIYAGVLGRAAAAAAHRLNRGAEATGLAAALS
ncbi:NAD(P)/FAD-dependent oxidoreductase [Phenylobacterium sp. J367]|uniref:dihydrolipoyl dehydrogenase family protein n=1 Tax=Phenylobacterium sp. J367 TaxID=2898435 RepID=UPI0021512530|nr:NAD(P)/FAD-dependent oxidoreductase [Phenylobacterium sp. J367]MCR5878891.1 NAD(P)/FAD-dependent oxidoreductase [Phenylobacterium sp. J367]